MFIFNAGCQNDCVLRHGWQKANAIIGKVLMTGAALLCAARKRAKCILFIYVRASSTLISTMLSRSHTLLRAECVCFVKSIYTCRHRSQWNWEIYDVFFSQSIYMYLNPHAVACGIAHNVMLMWQKIYWGGPSWYLPQCESTFISCIVTTSKASIWN